MRLPALATPNLHFRFELLRLRFAIFFVSFRGFFYRAAVNAIPFGQRRTTASPRANEANGPPTSGGARLKRFCRRKIEAACLKAFIACRASGTDCAKGMSNARWVRPAASAPRTTPKAPAIGVVEGPGVNAATPGRRATGIAVRAATTDDSMSRRTFLGSNGAMAPVAITLYGTEPPPGPSCPYCHSLIPAFTISPPNAKRRPVPSSSPDKERRFFRSPCNSDYSLHHPKDHRVLPVSNSRIR